MKIRSLAVAAAAMVALAGCGGDKEPAGTTAATTAPAAATTAPADPATELKTAAAGLADTPAKIKVSVSGVDMEGSVDVKAKKTELTSDLGDAGEMVVRQVGDDMWVKASDELAAAVGGKAGKWMHVDISKVSEKSALNVKNQDPTAMAKMVEASGDVRKTGDHEFAGTLDLTMSPTFKAPTNNAIGDKMKKTPFTAKTDDQGHLTELVVDMNAVVAGSGKMTATYSDLGKPVDVSAPPSSDVIPMPAKFLKAMGA